MLGWLSPKVCPPRRPAPGVGPWRRQQACSSAASCARTRSGGASAPPESPPGRARSRETTRTFYFCLFVHNNFFFSSCELCVPGNYPATAWVFCRFPQFCLRFCPRPALRLRHSVAFGGRKTALRNGNPPVWQSPLASSLLPPRARPRGCEGPIRARGLQVCHHSGLANRPGTSRRLPDGATTARGPLKLAPDCHARLKSGARRTPLSSCSR